MTLAAFLLALFAVAVDAAAVVVGIRLARRYSGPIAAVGELLGSLGAFSTTASNSVSVSLDPALVPADNGGGEPYRREPVDGEPAAQENHPT